MLLLLIELKKSPKTQNTTQIILPKKKKKKEKTHTNLFQFYTLHIYFFLFRKNNINNIVLHELNASILNSIACMLSHHIFLIDGIFFRCTFKLKVHF